MRIPGNDRGWAIAGALLLAHLAATVPAVAQAPDPKDEADRLFFEGNAHLARGEIPAACEKYERSLRLLRRGGTLLNLALCREAAGDAAGAIPLFIEALEAAGRSGHADRAQVAREHLTALRPTPPPLPATPPAADGRPAEPPVHPSPDAGSGARDAVSRAGGLTHRWQPGAVARIDVDPLHPGARGVAGLTFGLGDQLEVGASALLGRDMGLEPQLTVYLLHETAWKPLLNAGVPIFFGKGPDAGVRGSAGVQWDLGRHLGVFAQIGGAYFANAPAGYSRGVLLPSLGVQGRL